MCTQNLTLCLLQFISSYAVPSITSQSAPRSQKKDRGTHVSPLLPGHFLYPDGHSRGTNNDTHTVVTLNQIQTT